MNYDIGKVAEILGVTMDKVYVVLQKQTQVELINYVVIIFVGMLIILLGRIMGKTLERWEIREYNDSDGFWKWIIYLFCGSIGLLIIFTSISVVYQILLNPDWYMFEKILTMVRG